ncbi:MAG: hypothetical protein ACJ76W_00575 [Chloroflexota bacterium]
MTVTRAPLRARIPVLAFAAVVVAGCGVRGAAPATDPGVRGNLGPEFMWAVGEPTKPLGTIDPEAAREAVDRARDVIEPDRDFDFPISIVAQFDTPEHAVSEAEQLRDILEASARWYDEAANTAARAARDDPERQAHLIPPEVAAMRENLLAPGERGMGWGGRPEDADDAVYTIGLVVVATGFESDAFATGADPPLHPIAHLLAAAGADVRLEGDRFGEGSIVFDMSCRLADRTRAEGVLDEVGDAVVTGHLNTRPPWIGPPLTSPEALARATFRRFVDGFVAGADDSRILDYAQRYANAGTSDEREAAVSEMERYLLQRGLEHVEGELDPAVFALILKQPDTTDKAARQAWSRDISGRMGALPMHPSEFGDRPTADDAGQLAWTGSLRRNGDRLELGWLSFGKFSAAMPYVAAYLEDHGCDDVRLGTVDFDAVRGD